MATQVNKTDINFTRWATLAFAVLLLGIGLLPRYAQAVPSFARQTGQNCVACHAGGQFPELTPYGRMFKLTGYTIGQRTMPLSVMAVAGAASVANTTQSDANGPIDPQVGFYKNNTPVFAVGSLFAAGKISENIGAFTQFTYDNYASDNGDNTFSGHTQVDNVDLRYAEHVVDGKKDWVYGISLNNNPSVSDVWNTAAAWMQYVPTAGVTSHQFADANTPFPGFGAGSNIAGVTAYGYWNKTLYAEVGFYGTAENGLRFMSAGVDQSAITHLSGTNPYWRLAYTHEWGASNIMVGATGMNAHVFDASSDIGDPGNLGSFRNLGFDLQYQYLLDPHTFTVQLAHMHQEQTYSDNALNALDVPLPSGTSDTTDTVRAKVSYIYQAKYGGSLAAFKLSGSTNNQGDLATTGMTYEAFYVPLQNLRIGLQYTTYGKYLGATNNYDGFGRNASDNNTLYLYAWFAY